MDNRQLTRRLSAAVFGCAALAACAHDTHDVNEIKAPDTGAKLGYTIHNGIGSAVTIIVDGAGTPVAVVTTPSETQTGLSTIAGVVQSIGVGVGVAAGGLVPPAPGNTNISVQNSSAQRTGVSSSTTGGSATANAQGGQGGNANAVSSSASKAASNANAGAAATAKSAPVVNGGTNSFSPILNSAPPPPQKGKPYSFNVGPERDYRIVVKSLSFKMV